MNNEKVIYKKWFLAKTLVDKFCPQGYDSDESMRFARRLGVQVSRIKDMFEPNKMINEKTADEYAVRLRLSSGQYMV